MKLNQIIYNFFYKNKFKKLNISNDLLDFLLERLDEKKYKNILKIISNSKNETDFKENLINYISENEKELNIISKSLIVGSLVSNYNINLDLYKKEKINFDNFKYSKNENEEILENAQSFFIEYIQSDNSLKNEFLKDETKPNLYNYRLDLDYEKTKKCLKAL